MPLIGRIRDLRTSDRSPLSVLHWSRACKSSAPGLTMRSDGRLVSSSTSPPPPVRDMRILSKSLSHARSESLGSTWSLRTVTYLNPCPWRTWSKSFGAAPPSFCGQSPYYTMPMFCWPPSTGKSQVLLCAATFKFRGHLSIAFSWSLAFSRPKNGPDRITGSHSAAKRRFQRSARHATSEGGHEQASDTVSASLARLEHTLAVHNPPPLAFHRSYYDSSPRL